MNAREIVDRLAREKRVEQIVARIAGVTALTADLEDLCQMLYLTLLEYGDQRLADLWDADAINFLIVRLVKLNLFSKNSRYYYLIRLFSIRSADISALEFKTDDTNANA